jgi:transcriptional regulator
MSVHARGVLKFLDEQALLDVLNRTTTHFENNPHSPASFSTLPEEYVSKMIKAIVAFEIEVTEIDNVFKLSQNRDEESKKKIVKELRNRNDEDSRRIATEVEKRMHDNFSLKSGESSGSI